jgi:hypothetical protein
VLWARKVIALDYLNIPISFPFVNCSLYHFILCIGSGDSGGGGASADGAKIATAVVEEGGVANAGSTGRSGR